MSRKATDLRLAMRSTANPAAAARETPAAPLARSEPSLDRNPHFRPGRAGKTNVTGYFPGEVKKQLRILAAERDTTIQDLMAEALNDLFAKYGKPEIAPLGDSSQ
jgi:hypothetical protein